MFRVNTGINRIKSVHELKSLNRVKVQNDSERLLKKATQSTKKAS